MERWTLIKPFLASFLTVLIAAGAVGYSVARLVYSGTIDTLNAQIKLKDNQLQAKDSDVERYKRALGITAGSVGNLLELTDEELATKAINKGKELHELCGKGRDLDPRNGEASMKLLFQLSDEFHRGHAPDAFLIDNEIRRRMDASAIAAIPRG